MFFRYCVFSSALVYCKKGFPEKRGEEMMKDDHKTAVSIAANREWIYTVEYFGVRKEELSFSPFGPYFTKSIGGKDVLFYFAGRGRKAAGSAAAQYFIDKKDIERIIVAGTAAGIDEKNRILDIIIPNRAEQCDTTVREMGPLLNDRYTVELELPSLPFDFKTGVIGSTDKPVVMWRDHVELRENGITIADMEAAAIAYICRLNGVEWLFDVIPEYKIHSSAKPDNELQTLFLFILMIVLWAVSRRMNAVVPMLFDQVAIFFF